MLEDDAKLKNEADRIHGIFSRLASSNQGERVAAREALERLFTGDKPRHPSDFKIIPASEGNGWDHVAHLQKIVREQAAAFRNQEASTDALFKGVTTGARSAFAGEPRT